MARDVVLYVEQPGSMEGTRTEEFLREISVRFMVKNLVSFSENLWDDRWGKGKEESGTRDYIRTAHMFAGQLRGAGGAARIILSVTLAVLSEDCALAVRMVRFVTKCCDS